MGKLYCGCRAWYSGADAVMNVGSTKATEVDRLIKEANQFLWGPKDVAEGVLALQQRLRDAKEWLSKVMHHSFEFPHIPAT